MKPPLMEGSEEDGGKDEFCTILSTESKQPIQGCHKQHVHTQITFQINDSIINSYLFSELMSITDMCFKQASWVNPVNVIRDEHLCIGSFL